MILQVVDLWTASISRLRPLVRYLRNAAVDTQPLRIPSFRRFFVSMTVTTIGSQLTAVAVPKQLYDLTGSSGYVGLAGAVALVPFVTFGLWGGAIADAMDRRKLMLITNVGIACTSALFCVQASMGLRSVWVVLLLLGLQQAFLGLNGSARGASIAGLIPVGQLPQAGALSGIVFSFGSVVGPLLAGALIPSLGIATLYLVDTLALTATIWAVWKLPPLPPQSAKARSASLRDIAVGFRYLAGQKILLAVLTADIIAMVAGMPRALFPEMSQNTFGDPPGGGLAYGWLFAAIPIGTMLCGLVSGKLTKVPRHGVAVATSVILWGLAIAAFGSIGSLPLAVLCLAIAGAADMSGQIFCGAIMQTAVTDEMRGRVQGVYVVVLTAGPRLADAMHGSAAAVAGTATVATGGGLLVVALMLMLFASSLLPTLLRYRTLSTAPAG